MQQHTTTIDNTSSSTATTINAFSMYISMGMLKRIQEQVPLMSQLTAKLCLRAYATTLSRS